MQIGARRPDVVAITAAMMHPVGLDKFQTRFPERTFDVGIAEQHAATSAAGLALGGLHPVVAVYATFLNRAFDQVLMDVALHKCGVTFVLDRSGVTGDDGASHNGMWDMSVLQVVPGLRLAAPRDVTRMRDLLDEAVEVADAPTVVRFPKGPPPDDIEAIDRIGGVDVLVRDGLRDVLVVAVGSMAGIGVDVAERLTAQGIGVTVVDPRWVKPVDPALVQLAADHRLVVTIEDNGVIGGVGAVLLQTLSAAGIDTPVRLHGIPQEFLGHAKRAVILERVGLSAQKIALDIVHEMTGKGRTLPTRTRRTTGRSSMPTGTADAADRRRVRSALLLPVLLISLLTACGDDSPTAPSDPDAGVAEAIQRTLRQRARAIVDRDPVAFERTLGQRDRGFLAEQDGYYQNLGQLPLGTVRFDLAEQHDQAGRRRLLGRGHRPPAAPGVRRRARRHPRPLAVRPHPQRASLPADLDDGRRLGGRLRIPTRSRGTSARSRSATVRACSGSSTPPPC